VIACAWVGVLDCKWMGVVAVGVEVDWGKGGKGGGGAVKRAGPAPVAPSSAAASQGRRRSAGKVARKRARAPGQLRAAAAPRRRISPLFRLSSKKAKPLYLLGVTFNPNAPALVLAFKKCLVDLLLSTRKPHHKTSSAEIHPQHTLCVRRGISYTAS